MLVNDSKNTANGLTDQTIWTGVEILNLREKITFECYLVIVGFETHKLINLKEAGEIADVYCD